MPSGFAPHLQPLVAVLDRLAFNADDEENEDPSARANIDEHPSWSFEVNDVRVSVFATTKSIGTTQGAAYAAAVVLQDRIVNSGPWRVCCPSDLATVAVPSPGDDEERGDISGWFGVLRLVLRLSD